MEERPDYEDVSTQEVVETIGESVFDEIENDGAKKYKKKKRGIAGFFQCIGMWFKNLHGWRKGLTITGIIAIILSLIIFLTPVGSIINILFNYSKNYNPEVAEKTPEELGFENVIDEKVVNVALFGIDSRSEGFKGNSDSIMILSLDTEAKTVKIVSIVRDTLVPIEVNGKVRYAKINAAYQIGGPVLAIKTLNQCFGLDISRYATVNFNGMAEIIDAVGGIDAELVAGEVVSVNKSIYALNGCIYDVCQRLKIDPEPYYILKPGKYHLNGIQAVAYSRIRKTKNVWGTNNDYGRTDRQRYVMEQLFNKALTLPKSEYLKLAEASMPHTETSLTLTEIMGLAWDIMLQSPTFSQTRVPLTQYQMPSKNIPKVGDCVYYDLDYVKDLLHAYFYEGITPEEYMEQNGVRKNDWYAQATGQAPKPETKPEDTPSEETPTPETPGDVQKPEENEGDNDNTNDNGNEE